MRDLFDVIGPPISALTCLFVVLSDGLAEPGAIPKEPASAVRHSGIVTILAVIGTVEYFDRTQWKPAKVGIDLDTAKIRTAAESYADMRVNGNASVIRILPESLVEVPVMGVVGFGSNANSVTIVNLRSGGIIAIIGPLPINSRYEFKTPRDHIGIVDHHTVVELAANVGLGNDGQCELSVSDIAGKVFVGGKSGTNTILKAQERLDSSDPGAKPMNQQELDNLNQVFGQMKKESGGNR